MREEMNGRAARRRKEGSAFSGPFGGESLLTAAKDDDADAIDALVQVRGDESESGGAYVPRESRVIVLPP